MNKILDVIEDIKQNITDNQYKTIMESLMEMNKMYNDGVPLLNRNQERNKFVSIFNWLDAKLEITNDCYDSIRKTDLQKYIITNYFENRYYQNIDFVKQILKIYITFSTKEQHENLHYQYIKYRR